ncbi:UvrD-helicase domain-containing protein [Parapedobacter koreensis]|uniref:DNA 3'-5' helicase II n=1 Tax=Parapedobacter koreensis TaxID=332977 RepID=A0A1H7U2C3_9SPHI|nr:UvrD-helicase domain-containing protein [Parapedobacter koreensis]SEL90838.1 UvrD/REP helicase N-terminal domain-containing protein [Parapedobacter koreensis]
MLDSYTLVSNSDAHSPQKLGREANLFETERSYYALFDALKTKQGFLGTYEFFPEEGKYHMDGHRKCDVCLEPEESRRHGNRCPKCGQPLTIGVLHRVTELADRQQPQRPAGAADFHYIIPLPEILAEVRKASSTSKAVSQAFQQAISSFGNEFTLLNETPIEDIEKRVGVVLAEAIRRMRSHQVSPQGGYDGEYGTIRIFNDGEIARLTGQMNFFGLTAEHRPAKRKSKDAVLDGPRPVQPPVGRPAAAVLNPEQLIACETPGTVLVTAGPGTGKTRTLIHWIARCIRKCHAQPHEVMAVTFTNKAADEVKARLTAELGERANDVVLGTFHALCFGILQAYDEHLAHVYDAESRCIILGMLFSETDEKALKKLAAQLGDYFETNNTGSTDEIQRMAVEYRQFTAQQGGVDVADIIGSVIRLWKVYPERLESYRKRIQYVAIDELQDISPVQYAFLALLAQGKQVFAIGDPNQSIYGFRGADVGLFFRFGEDFRATEVALGYNYRATDTLVRAAGQVIRYNVVRKDADLVTYRPAGERIRVCTTADAQAEALFVINEIE